MKKTAGIVLGVILSVAVRAAWAVPVTLTMDELPFQPVNGLSFRGVTFHFSVSAVPSTDANYGSGNGGQQTFTQDPVIEGDSSGILTMDFQKPTAFLNFGVSESTPMPLTPGFSVELFDENLMSLGTTPVNTAPVGGDFFTEGQFTYSGTPISRAVVSFDPLAGRFGLDNLNFDGTVNSSVPAVGTSGLIGLTLVMLAAGLMRLRAQQAR